MKEKIEAKLISTKKLRETKCHKCKRIFYRKLVPSKESGRELTKINDITYWSDGKKWGRFSILCRGCLADWFENFSMDFYDLVRNKSKQMTFHHYRYLGLLKAEKEVYKK
jgi:hypothetical protein